jgi:hypothetical protein
VDAGACDDERGHARKQEQHRTAHDRPEGAAAINK